MNEWTKCDLKEKISEMGERLTFPLPVYKREYYRSLLHGYERQLKKLEGQIETNIL